MTGMVVNQVVVINRMYIQSGLFKLIIKGFVPTQHCDFENLLWVDTSSIQNRQYYSLQSLHFQFSIGFLPMRRRHDGHLWRLEFVNSIQKFWSKVRVQSEGPCHTLSHLGQESTWHSAQDILSLRWLWEVDWQSLLEHFAKSGVYRYWKQDTVSKLINLNKFI